MEMLIGIHRDHHYSSQAGKHFSVIDFAAWLKPINTFFIHRLDLTAGWAFTDQKTRITVGSKSDTP